MSNKYTKQWAGEGFTVRQLGRDSALDAMALMQFKQGVTKFIHILTNDTTIPVKYNGVESYTDGKAITLSADIDDENLDSTCGLALHEASHIVYTNMNIIDDTYVTRSGDTVYTLWHAILYYLGIASIPPYHKALFQGIGDATSIFGGKQLDITGIHLVKDGVAVKYRTNNNAELTYINSAKNAYARLLSDIKTRDTIVSIIKSNLFSVINIVEDARINALVCENYPGYNGYYNALSNRYFDCETINYIIRSGEKSLPHFDSYIFYLCNWQAGEVTKRMNDPAALDKLLPGLSEIYSIFNPYDILRLNDTEDVHDLSMILIHTMIELCIKHSHQLPTEPPRQKQPTEDFNKQSLSTTDGLKEPGTNRKLSKSKAIQDIQSLVEASDYRQRSIINKGNAHKDPVEGKFSPLAVAEALSKSDITKSKIQVRDPSGNRPVTIHDSIIVRGIKDTDIDSVLMADIARTGKNNKVLVNEYKSGISAGKILGNKLNTRDEHRILRSSRLSTGKLDKRLLPELGYANEGRVFYNESITTAEPVYIHISIDVSGSMQGSPIAQVIKAVTSIIVATEGIQSIRLTISLRGTSRAKAVSTDTIAITWLVYDSVINTYKDFERVVNSLEVNSYTPEGLCFEPLIPIINNESRGDKVIFINLSDGMPQCEKYEGRPALEHTKSIVDKMRKMNWYILSYYIESTFNKGSYKDFEYMYGKSASKIDINSITEIARTLNDILAV